MALLSDLVSEIARLSGKPEKSVALLARHMRENGLVSQSGRGRSAARMLPSDAANMLLAYMTTDQLSQAPARVRLYREAKERSPRLNGAGLPPLEGLRSLGKGHQFGDALEVLFTGLSFEGGLINNNTGFPFTNYALTVSEPSIEANLWLDDGNSQWNVIYHRNPPEFDNQPKEKWHTIALESRLFKRDLSIEKKVSSKTLYALADCIADRTDDDEEFDIEIETD